MYLNGSTSSIHFFNANWRLAQSTSSLFEPCRGGLGCKSMTSSLTESLFLCVRIFCEEAFTQRAQSPPLAAFDLLLKTTDERFIELMTQAEATHN
jgi:hypothetical protein